MKIAGKINTLIVDDEPLARRRIHKLVSQDSDIEIVGDCANGHEAIAAIHQQKPQLVFLDVQMPEITGFDVLEALKSSPATMNIPVVVISAYVMLVENCVSRGASACVQKPFDIDDLVMQVSMLCKWLSTIRR